MKKQKFTICTIENYCMIQLHIRQAYLMNIRFDDSLILIGNVAHCETIPRLLNSGKYGFKDTLTVLDTPYELISSTMGLLL